MTRSLLQQPFNQDDLANEWEEAYNNQKFNSGLKRSTNMTAGTNSSQFSHFNAIFSDDEEDDHPQQQQQQHGLTSRWLQSSPDNILSSANLSSVNMTGYIDPVLSSSTYHIHQADNALQTLKHVVLEDGWKKALKHKSGVVVHMKNGIYKGDKTPIFKGEAIIQGFSPQAIFYVIGMRKLWDEQYEDGNLVENLSDTTSLTYEIMKPTATSKSRDLALVEKIECTQNGAIVFACTSVETPRIPRINGRTRLNTKLQGWILEPLHGGPTPATKVVFVIQESMKGWVPGFAKKTLARRPLVIAKVAEYLDKKTERMRSQQQANRNGSGLLQSINSGHSRRPSVMSSHTPPQQQTLRHLNSSNRILSPLNNSSNRPSPELSHHSILVAPKQQQQQQQVQMPPTPPPTVKKHISFADRDITYTATNNEEEDTSGSSVTNDSNTTIPPKKKTATNATIPFQAPPIKQHLYPSHRHPIQKVESIQLLKKLTFTNDNWKLTKELNDGSRYYILNSNILIDEEDEFIMNHLDHRLNGNGQLLKRRVPFIRADGIIDGGWTAEQLCSVIHCFGSRKLWDSSFEGGQTIERFSQKEYLVQWYLGSNLPIASVDLSAITSIESDPVTGTVYTATTSVIDQQIPPDESGHRIRAYSDLYGWVFRPKFDKQGRTLFVNVSFVCNLDFKYAVPNHVLQAWIDESLKSISHIQHYLTQYGCPPYIRRVAGKVIREGFDPLTNNYQIVFIAKHRPSNSYRARKQQQQQNHQSLWCTDIRFHKSMFPHGLDITVIPENVARVEVSPKDNRSIKIFTTNEAIEGKQVTFTLTPLVSTDGTVNHYTTYKYNGDLFVQQQQQRQKKQSSTNKMTDSNMSSLEEIDSPIEGGSSSVHQTKAVEVPASTVEKVEHIVDQAVEDIKKELSTVPVTDTPPVTPQPTPPPSSSANPTVHVTKAEIASDEKNNAEGDETIPLKLPKGYVLIPEHQNNNIIMITDELSFNGQQISIIFLAMVVCYYMGKFTSCNSC